MFVLCVCALGAASIGCGEDTNGGAGAAGSAGSAGDGGSAGAGGSGGGVAPVIDYVAWEYGNDCRGSGATTLRVTVSAKDADDPTGLTLTYSGSLMYCDDFSVTSRSSPVTETVDCDLLTGRETLEVKVKDPQDNEDTLGAGFESATCEAGCVEGDNSEVGCP
jgi:hypothetical protein